MALREVVNLLVLIETFVKVALAAATGPEYVPFVTFCGLEIGGF